MKKRIALCVLAAVALNGCRNNSVVQTEAQAFITRYTDGSQTLQDSVMAAKWDAAVHIVAGDSSTALRIEKAELALATFTADKKNTEEANTFLAQKEQLTAIQVKQLEMVQHQAALGAACPPELVRMRVHKEAMQWIVWNQYYAVDGTTDTLYCMDCGGITISDYKRQLGYNWLLKSNERASVWKGLAAIGKTLAPEQIQLRDLRNQCVRTGKYTDFFHYKVSEYGMSTQQMMPMLHGYARDLWPLYRELHTWLRYELAQRYHCTTVPDYLPAHWLDADMGADGITLSELDDTALSNSLTGKVTFTEAINGYAGMGFAPLPEGVYKKSLLYKYSADSLRAIKEGNSFWNMDLGQDVRIILTASATNADRWMAANGQLGFAYYALVVAGNNTRVMLRAGANRAFPKAISELMAIESTRPAYLQSCGLNSNEPANQQLLREALHCVPAVLYAAGTAGHFEKEFYTEGLSEDQINSRWWELAKKYQGIVPPMHEANGRMGRAEKTEGCAAAIQRVFTEQPGESYDAAISYMLLFQIQQHIADKVLHQDVHSTNYANSKAVGDYLRSIMKIGATEDWREVVKKYTGDSLSSKAMVAYFQPLMVYLKEANKRRTYTLPETLD